MYISIFSTIGGWFSDAVDTVGGWFSDGFNAIGDWFSDIWDTVSSFFTGLYQQAVNAILEFFYWVLYEIDIFVCKVLRAIYEVFKVFVGMDKATYYGKSDYLINIFANQTFVARAFWGIAGLGVAVTFILTIWAVIKQTFNLDDKQENSLGKILRTGGSSILIIFSLTFIFQLAINFSGVLLNQIDLVFDMAPSESQVTDIVFDDEDYATMARILDTIGDYSLNDSSSSTYNVNACFNTIRFDMQVLDNKGFFDMTYLTHDTDGNQEETWQYIIAKIGRAHSITEDQPLDVENDALTYAIVYAMDYVTNSSEKNLVLQEYHENEIEFTSQNPELDAVLFLTGTISAARNSEYNTTSGIYDALRKPYITGEKSIYNYQTVKQDFDLAPGSFDHLLIIIGGLVLCYIFCKVTIEAITRLYTLLLLYIVSPFFVATRPIDGGQRFKNWVDSFIVTLFAIYGTIISIRLFMLLVPIVLDSNLVIAGGGFVGAVAKLLFIVGSAYTCEQANELIGDMLATTNAGGISIRMMSQASANTEKKVEQTSKQITNGIANAVSTATTGMPVAGGGGGGGDDDGGSGGGMPQNMNQ